MSGGDDSNICPIRPFNPTRPGYACHWEAVQAGRGHILRPGLYFHDIRDRDNAEIDTRICSPLEVVAVTSDEHGANHGLLLRLLPRTSRHSREWAAPMALLAGDGLELRSALLSLGVIIEPKQRQALMGYLMSSEPARHALAATRTGWHGPGLFVMPGRMIGGAACDVVFQSAQAGGHDYAMGGTLAGWQADIGSLCVGNPVLILATCAALAGPLLSPLGRQGGGFHLYGDSSSGKTIALDVAASVWGRPRDFRRTWNATSTGLEGLATLRNDTLLALDEIGEANPQTVGDTIYALANGTGRQRGGVTGHSLAPQRWRVIVLSTGEQTVGRHMECGGKASKPGQDLRLLDVPAYRRYGAFDNLHDLALAHDATNASACKGAGRPFADHLHGATGQHYGHIGPAFVGHLVQLLAGAEGMELLRAAHADLLQSFPESGGQAGRAAARFAVAALAGELATDAGLLPWPKGAALAAMLELYGQWAGARGPGQSEDTKIRRRVAAFITRHPDRFARLGDIEAAPVANRAGWWRELGEDRVFLLTPEALGEAAPGYDLKRIGAALDGAGALVERDSGPHLTKRVRIKGEGLVRVYVIDSNQLEFEQID
ncbi:DUF927 domain-containing protein [Pseudomonas sp. BN414]|uniref:DUF927 domain-containing protein n=1 Tax=Pseudomonas sp. BN414 TaxID=2567888 RepID=UPI002453EE09|nr:DUF927 domain-containing protein [Pseudomonas sp. BN414]MDH4565946.1 DUF927 domain-containing protein [Pseudomonas sp. BN414]